MPFNEFTLTSVWQYTKQFFGYPGAFINVSAEGRIAEKRFVFCQTDDEVNSLKGILFSVWIHDLMITNQLVRAQ